jgi:2-amino-4-hydroxy-6-hydroxymethyldihydropteridine diphosphokinase
MPPMPTIYLALEANLGDREKYLRDAISQIAEFVTIEKISSLYEIRIPHTREQTHSLALVCGGNTLLTPVNLFRHCRQIENEFGQNAGLRSNPRPIDIDILLYDRLIELSPALTIPHPRMHERASVLAPLDEIAPTLVHPRKRATIHQLLSNLKSTDHVRLFKPFA